MNLVWAIIINIFITIFEVVIGIAIGSLALISDALHNFSDVGAMVLSWFGERVSAKESDTKKTYGYKRAEILVAFINSAVLLVIVAAILFQASVRLTHPSQIESSKMIWVALVALVGNGIATFLLEKDTHKNMNMKSAWLHSMQDAVFSLGVVIGAVIIYFTGLYVIDPLISILLSVIVIKEVFSLLKRAMDILMESVPEGINFDDVKKELGTIEHVEQVSDLHIWQTGSRNRFLSAHLIVSCPELKQADEIIAAAQRRMAERFEINHLTIQINPEGSDNCACNHCN